MKKVVRCGNCGVITRFYGAYRVREMVDIIEKTPIWGKLMWLCPACYKRAGYKIMRGKKK
jgi:heterodisulfide reductase subunit C